MKMRDRMLVGGGVVFLILASGFWYSTAANYDYGALAGTYRFRRNGEICTLYLHADRSFEQELLRSGGTQKSRGQWHRFGESHVSFSKEFMTVSGEEKNAEGEAHGEFEKVAGLFPVLVLAPLPNGPRLRRRLFR